MDLNEGKLDVLIEIQLATSFAILYLQNTASGA